MALANLAAASRAVLRSTGTARYSPDCWRVGGEAFEISASHTRRACACPSGCGTEAELNRAALHSA